MDNVVELDVKQEMTEEVFESKIEDCLVKFSDAFKEIYEPTMELIWLVEKGAELGYIDEPVPHDTLENTKRMLEAGKAMFIDGVDPNSEEFNAFFE